VREETKGGKKRFKKWAQESRVKPCDLEEPCKEILPEFLL
jgi:hypothetical protein